MASADERLDRIERALHELAQRVARMEHGWAPERPTPRPEPPAAVQRAAPQQQGPEPQLEERRTAPPALPRVDIEDLLGGRVLAWLGGAAVIVGVVLFVAYAVR